MPGAWYTLRKRVDDMATSLPAGVRGPFFNDDFGDVYGVIYALESDGFPNAEVKLFADNARQQLLRVPTSTRWRYSATRTKKYSSRFRSGDCPSWACT